MERTKYCNTAGGKNDTSFDQNYFQPQEVCFLWCHKRTDMLTIWQDWPKGRFRWNFLNGSRKIYNIHIAFNSFKAPFLVKSVWSMNPGRPRWEDNKYYIYIYICLFFLFFIDLIFRCISLTPEGIVSFISQLLTHPAKSFGLSQRIWSPGSFQLSLGTCHLLSVTCLPSRMSNIACRESPVTCQ